MNFTEACSLLSRGAKIRMEHWKPEHYIRYNQEDKSFYNEKEELHNIWLGDYLDNTWERYNVDWKNELVNKEPKLHTFEEALKAYKSGKNIRRKGYHYEVYYDFDCEFDRDDVMANDWIIIDKEETK